VHELFGSPKAVEKGSPPELKVLLMGPTGDILVRSVVDGEEVYVRAPVPAWGDQW
jgi:hypothetical protein